MSINYDVLIEISDRLKFDKLERRNAVKLKVKGGGGIGFSIPLHFIAKISSNGCYRYYCIDTYYRDWVDEGRIVGRLVDEAFGQLKDNEFIAGIRCNNKDVVRNRYHSPDF